MILTRKQLAKLPFAGQNTQQLLYSCVKSKTLTNICTEEDFFAPMYTFVICQTILFGLIKWCKQTLMMGKLHLNLNCFFNFTTHCTHTLLEAKSLTTCVKKTQIATTRANSSIFYQLRPPLSFCYPSTF